MKKDIAIFALFVAVLISILCFNDFQSVDQYYINHIDDIKSNSKTVFLSIDCENALKSNKLSDNIRNRLPKDGKIIKQTEYVLRDNDTVYSVLLRAVKFNKIQFEFQGSDKNSFNTVYIEGINYLYEFDCSSVSGWMYKVNGEFPQVGCSNYKLKDKDRIQIVYSNNLGKDLGKEESNQ